MDKQLIKHGRLIGFLDRDIYQLTTGCDESEQNC